MIRYKGKRIGFDPLERGKEEDVQVEAIAQNIGHYNIKTRQATLSYLSNLNTSLSLSLQSLQALLSRLLQSSINIRYLALYAIYNLMELDEDYVQRFDQLNAAEYVMKVMSEERVREVGMRVMGRLDGMWEEVYKQLGTSQLQYLIIKYPDYPKQIQHNQLTTHSISILLENSKNPLQKTLATILLFEIYKDQPFEAKVIQQIEGSIIELLGSEYVQEEKIMEEEEYIQQLQQQKPMVIAQSQYIHPPSIIPSHLNPFLYFLSTLYSQPQQDMLSQQPTDLEIYLKKLIKPEMYIKVWEWVDKALKGSMYQEGNRSVVESGIVIAKGVGEFKTLFKIISPLTLLSLLIPLAPPCTFLLNFLFTSFLSQSIQADIPILLKLISSMVGKGFQSSIYMMALEWVGKKGKGFQRQVLELLCRYFREAENLVKGQALDVMFDIFADEDHDYLFEEYKMVDLLEEGYKYMGTLNYKQMQRNTCSFLRNVHEDLGAFIAYKIKMMKK